MDNRYHNTPDEELYNEIENANAQIEGWKNVIKRCNEEIGRRYHDKLEAAKTNTDKKTVRVDAADGFEAVSKTTKSVKYDDKLLSEVAFQLGWEKFKTIFQMTLKIPEKTYSALNAMAITDEQKKRIEASRTVEYKETVTLEKKTEK